MANDTTSTMQTYARTPFLVDRMEAARLLGVSAGTIDNLRKRGQLPSVKVLARRNFDVADLHRFIESRKVVAAP